MSPLTDRDIGELNNWVKGRIIQAARASFTPETTERERRETIDSAMALAATSSCTEGVGLQMMAGTFDGWAHVLWTGLKHNHPDLKPDEVRAWINDPHVLEEARVEFDRINEIPGSAAAKKKKKG